MIGIYYNYYYLKYDIVMPTFSTPGYLFSSRRSLKISTELYHPVKGAAGNCKPPTSASKQDTPGSGNHSRFSSLIADMLK